MKDSIYFIGNAHLDPTWLWRWQEGCGEVLQTFRSAVDRLKEYNDFVFTCSSACYYKWVEEIDPALFSDIRELVKEGRWVPVNGWWLQPDCNMPCAESFARQALYSQLYYKEKFGKICTVGYNVDSFGHGAMIPKFLNNAGMRCYVMMRPSAEENPDMPKGLFWWDSPDGSRVLTYRIPGSYAESGKNAIDGALESLKEEFGTANHGMMLFYGVGNHGGGPTKGDIEHLTAVKNEGYGTMKFSSPEEFFEEQCNLPLDLPGWDTELQHHASGCYSATSLIKQLNRKTENALIGAEKWSSVSSALTGEKAATEEFAKAWQKLCYNQFHDILCGCSIMEAYEDAKLQLGFAQAIAQDEENKALQIIAGRVDTWLDGVSDSVSCSERHHCRNLAYPRPVIVFNSLSRKVITAVRTYHPSSRVTDSEGRDVLFSNVRSSRSNDSHEDTVFLAEIPALGYALYWLWHKDSDAVSNAPESPVKADSYSLENEIIRVEFDSATGGISSLVTKADGKEHLARASLVPTVIDNSKPDTWAHGIFSFHDVIGTASLSEIKVVESGGVRGVIRVKHTYKNSYISQDFILEAGSPMLRSKVRILWQEPLTMVKMPVSIPGKNPVATYEIPGGFIKRKANGDEDPALTWGDVTADGNGVSVITDSKYSYDCDGCTLSLTVLRNSIFADHFSHRPEADFAYCDEGLQRFEYGVYPHSGDAEKSEVSRLADLLNNKPVAVPAGYHKGDLPRKKSFINIGKDNIRLDCFKQCEDGSGEYILRLSETAGVKTKTSVVCNLIEAGFWADFEPMETKTFRIDDEGYITETSYLE